MKIFFENREVAEIKPVENGLNLTYNKDWLNLRGAFPISISMPFTTETYTFEKVFPWSLMNLLPENPQLKKGSSVFNWCVT